MTEYTQGPLNIKIRAVLEDEMVKDFEEAFHLLAKAEKLVSKHIYDARRNLKLQTASQWISNKRAHQIARMVDNIVEEENK